MSNIKKFESFRNPQWRHTIKIKHTLTNEDIDSLDEKNSNGFSIREISKILSKQVNKIFTTESIKIREGSHNAIEKGVWDYDIEEELMRVKDNFDFLAGLKEDDKMEEEYGIESVLKEFNLYLEDLYDLGDRKVLLKNGEFQKFIWIA